MKYKLKHLSKFCCKPANELEFEAVKMAAELGGVKWCANNDASDDYYNAFGLIQNQIVMFSYEDYVFKPNQTIPVLDFCKKLRMTEEEAEKIEDNRINLTSTEDEIWHLRHDNKAFYCEKGYEWQLNEDKREVTLIKIEQ